MFLKENVVKESMEIKEVNEVSGLYIIMESNEMMHNITVSMMKLEHTAVINEDENLLNEGVKETIAVFIEMLKRTWAKIKEWFTNFINNSKLKANLAKKFFDKHKDDLMKFEGNVKVEAYEYDMKVLTSFREKFGKYSNVEVTSVADEFNNLLKKEGYESVQDLRNKFRGTKKTKLINGDDIKKELDVVNFVNEDINMTTKHFKSLEQMYANMIASLNSAMSSSSEEEKANKVKEVKKTKNNADLSYKIFLTYSSMSMEVLSNSVAICKKALNYKTPKVKGKTINKDEVEKFEPEKFEPEKFEPEKFEPNKKGKEVKAEKVKVESSVLASFGLKF